MPSRTSSSSSSSTACARPGYAVDVAAPSRRTLRTVVHDFEPDSDAYVEKPGRRLEPDLAFSEVEPERYAGLVIPGGRAPEYIRVDPRRAPDRGALLRQRPARSGRSATGRRFRPRSATSRGARLGVPAARPDIEARRRRRTSRAPHVVDGNMVSCRGWGDLAEWSIAFVAALERARPTPPAEALLPAQRARGPAPARRA